MRNLPIQSAPVQRNLLTRGAEGMSSGGVSPSICGGWGPFRACIGPFLNEGGVSPSVLMPDGTYVGPFARDDAE